MERNGRIVYTSSPGCTSVLVLLQDKPYHEEAHHFHPCQGQTSVLCLSNVQSIHTSQTKWTLWVKCAWTQEGWSSMSALLDC